MKSLFFTNTSSEKFVGTWDNTPYPIEAGQTIMLPDYLAEHLAKHFVDREMNKMGIPTDNHARKDMIDACLRDSSVSAPNEDALKTQIMNQEKKEEPKVEEPKAEEAKPEETKPYCDSCDTKGPRHKKECPKVKKNEEEFVGLKE